MKADVVAHQFLGMQTSLTIDVEGVRLEARIPGDQEIPTEAFVTVEASREVADDR